MTQAKTMSHCAHRLRQKIIAAVLVALGGGSAMALSTAAEARCSCTQHHYAMHRVTVHRYVRTGHYHGMPIVDASSVKPDAWAPRLVEGRMVLPEQHQWGYNDKDDTSHYLGLGGSVTPTLRLPSERGYRN